MLKKLLVLFIVFSFFILEGSAQNQSIKNGISWLDNNGNRIQAHGASMLQHNGVYYLLGQDESEGFLTIGMNLYSSTDLMNWTFLNKVVDSNTNEELGTKSRITVRPNLVYNEKTKKFIIWATYKNQSLTYGAIAVFSSDTVDGKYTYEKTIEPFGYDSNDSAMFVDDDKTAYYVSNNKDNKSLNIYKLTDDYMDVTGNTTILFPGRDKEAPVLFKKDEIYYLMCSYKSGWDPNEGQYATSTSITGGWSALKNFGNKVTFDTQPTTFFTVTGTMGTSYFYVGDRWKDPDLRESKIIFLPIQAANGNLTLKYVPEFKIDMEKGTWAPFDDNTYVPNANWKVVSVSSQENTTTLAAKNVFDNNINTIWNTKYTSGNDSYPHEMIIDLGAEYDISGFTCVPRQDRNENTIADFQLFLSLDGVNWGKPVASGRMSYWSELYFPTQKGKFMKLVAQSALVNSRFASAAELKLITSSEYKGDRAIKPYFNVDNKGWKSGDNVLVSRGGTVVLGAQAEFYGGQTVYYGSFSYFGPENFYFDGRITTIENVDENKLGEYTVYYLDDLFSVKHHTFHVAFDLQVVSNEKTDVKCHGDATGTAEVEIEGGFAPYTYQWSDGQQTKTAVGLKSGTYEVVITDSKGNSITESVVIEEPDALELEVSNDEHIYIGYGDQCKALSVVSVKGGTGGYTYQWSNGETTESITVCPQTTTIYKLVVTDASGCSISKNVTVNVEDIRCTDSNGMEKILMCIQGKTKCVAVVAVENLLAEGYNIGSCDNDSSNEILFEVAAYPNPVNDYSDLKFVSLMDLTGIISIYNLSGELKLSTETQIRKGANHIKLNLSNFSPGVYILKVEGAGYHNKSIKLLKK